MLQELRAIAARAPDEHPFIGSHWMRSLRAERRRVGTNAGSDDLWQLLVTLGRAELEQGDHTNARRNLEQALALVASDPPTSPRVLQTHYQLGIVALRLAETQNCCLQHIPESCIVPIAAAAVHTKTEGSRLAMQHLSHVLAHAASRDALVDPARWLLNLAAMTLGEYPDGVPAQHRIRPEVFAGKAQFPRFANVASQLRVATVSLAGSVIADDFDNDDDIDLLVSTWDPSGQLQYFRNEEDGTFSNRTHEAGLTGLLGGLNMVQADYNNDGHLDALVLRGAWLREHGKHPNSLLRNNGDGTFTDVTFASGLGNVHYPTQAAAWLDYDLDGHLDLYIGNESSDAIRQQSFYGTTSQADEGLRAPSQLFRSRGDGTFVDMAHAAGVQNFAYVKGVSAGDFNADGWPDLLVSNIAGPKRLYRNRGDGTFVDVAAEYGIVKPMISFPCWFWDFNNDGALDILVASYSGRLDRVAAYYLGRAVEFEPSALYRNDGQSFKDVTREAGIDAPVLAMGANFGDLDNDGFLDFYLGTGDPGIESLMPNLMYWNQNGTRFEDVSMSGGFAHLQKGHGIAFADLDDDGDADVFEQMGGAVPVDAYADVLYQNPGFGNHWLTVHLVGTRSNRSAIGAHLRVEIEEDGKVRNVHRWVNSGGSFGANPLRQMVGLGRATRIRALEIVWPNGERKRFDDVLLDRTIRVVEGEETWHEVKRRPRAWSTPVLLRP